MRNPSTKDLPASGTIKLSEIKTEFGKGNNLLDYLGEGGVTSSAPVKLTDFYGTSSAPPTVINLPSDPMTYSEYYNNLNSSYGSYQGNMNSGWRVDATCNQGSSQTVSKFTNLTLASNTGYRVEYNASMNGAGYSTSLDLCLINYANSLKAGYAVYARSDDVNDNNRILSFENGRIYYNQNGVLVDAGLGSSLAKANSFTFYTKGQGPYQVGIQIRLGASQTFNYVSAAAAANSLVITQLGRRPVREALNELKQNKPQTLEISE
jgi:hypothetical protein